jgi:hypothetical protein
MADQLDPAVADLLEAFKGQTQRSSSDVEAALSRVSARVSAAPPPTGAASTTAWLPRIALATVVAGGGAWLATRTPEPIAAARAAFGAAAIDERPAAPPVERVVDEPAVEILEPIEPPSPTAAPTQKARPKAHVAADVDATSLAEELALLRQIRTDLRAGRADEALRGVRTHRREYAGSTFAEERDATEAVALCALGRVDEARARATVFSHAYPSSTRDLLATCDDDAQSTNPTGAPR